MTSLHIEHPITDLATWMQAITAFTEARRQGGVTAETVRHPVGDDTYVVIDLEFDTSNTAHAFLRFLETQIWAVTENAPALAGTPETLVLEQVDIA